MHWAQANAPAGAAGALRLYANNLSETLPTVATKHGQAADDQQAQRGRLGSGGQTHVVLGNRVAIGLESDHEVAALRGYARQHDVGHVVAGVDGAGPMGKGHAIDRQGQVIAGGGEIRVVAADADGQDRPAGRLPMSLFQ